MLEHAACQQCHQAMWQQVSETLSEFCKSCSDEYGKAFVRLHQYLLENNQPGWYLSHDLHKVALQTQIPEPFVRKFFRESYFRKSAFESAERFCIRCNTILLQDEKGYCADCQ